MVVESDLKTRHSVENPRSQLVILINPRFYLAFGFDINEAPFGQQFQKPLGRTFRADVDFALRPQSNRCRIPLLVRFTRLTFGIRDTERYEFVTAVALAAYGIPADVADNSSSFHLKNTIGLYIVRFCEALHLKFTKNVSLINDNFGLCINHFTTAKSRIFTTFKFQIRPVNPQNRVVVARALMS